MRHTYPGEERQGLKIRLNKSARTLRQTWDLKEMQHLTLRNMKEKAVMAQEVRERERNQANLVTSLQY